MVCCSDSGKIVLFGGFGAEAGAPMLLYLGDLWVYDVSANTWTELHPTGDVPRERREHAMVYASNIGKVILFGGIRGDELGDLWVYDVSANTWTERHPTGDVPCARVNHSTVYDSNTGKIILFGGSAREDYIGVILNDLWTYDPVSNVWTELHPTGDTPDPRYSHAMAYVPTSGKIVLFGGSDAFGVDPDRMLRDLWTYEIATNTWTEISSTGSIPTACSEHAMAYDASAGKVVLYGGQVPDPNAPANRGASPSGQFWTYDLGSNAWTQLNPTGNASEARYSHSLVYDPKSGKLVLFGGTTFWINPQGTWSFEL